MSKQEGAIDDNLLENAILRETENEVIGNIVSSKVRINGYYIA